MCLRMCLPCFSGHTLKKVWDAQIGLYFLRTQSWGWNIGLDLGKVRGRGLI